MDNRRWPSEPYDPYARRPQSDDDGWVVAGEEPNGRGPGGSGGRDRGTSRNGRGEPPPQRYGGRPSTYPGAGADRGSRPEPGRNWNNQYPPQARPYPTYPPGPYPPPPGPYPPPEPRPGYRSSPPPEPRPGYRYPPPPAAPRAYPPPERAGPRAAAPPDDELDEDMRAPLAPTLTWSVGVFVVPMLLYLAWAFTRSGVAEAGCVDASGAPCLSPRAEATENLLGVLPAITGAFVLSLLISIGLRRIATSWRAASVGLAAAVMGTGVATVVATALS